MLRYVIRRTARFEAQPPAYTMRRDAGRDARLRCAMLLCESAKSLRDDEALFMLLRRLRSRCCAPLLHVDAAL